jgi:hypothetical protein
MKRLKLKPILKEQDDNIDMIVGIIDMLLQIKDIENRKEIALDQIKQFKEQGIHFDYNSFLDAVGVSNEEISETIFITPIKKDLKFSISNIFEYVKILKQLDLSKFLYEAFISDLLKNTDTARARLATKGNRMRVEYVPISVRDENRTYKIMEFKTQSQSNKNKYYTQLIELTEIDSIDDSDITITERVKLATEAGHVKIHCNCPDFLYKGYEWMAYEGDYGIVRQEILPNIKNPNLEGALCKHLYAVAESIDTHIPQIAKDFEKYYKPKK